MNTRVWRLWNALLFCMHPIGRPATDTHLLSPLLPLPLGPPTALLVPETKPVKPEKVDLNKPLFPKDTISCAMRTFQLEASPSTEHTSPFGMPNKTRKRNTPRLNNTAYQELLLHDEREFTLEDKIDPAVRDA